MKPVMVVEDDDDIRTNLQELLEDEGYAVQTARNGEEALSLLRGPGEVPGLILLDVMMPVKDAYGFRREQELEARLATIPVIIMTADSQIESKSIRVGAKGYIRKPIDLDRLLGTVARYCA